MRQRQQQLALPGSRRVRGGRGGAGGGGGAGAGAGGDGGGGAGVGVDAEDFHAVDGAYCSDDEGFQSRAGGGSHAARAAAGKAASLRSEVS